VILGKHYAKINLWFGKLSIIAALAERPSASGLEGIF
jgi:hypothetical protein